MNVPPVILVNPTNQMIDVSEMVQFSVTATSCVSAPLVYQWKRNGADLPGMTSSNLSLYPVTSTDAGFYTVQVSDSAGTVLSAPAALTLCNVTSYGTRTLASKRAWIGMSDSWAFGVKFSFEEETAVVGYAILGFVSEYPLYGEQWEHSGYGWYWGGLHAGLPRSCAVYADSASGPREIDNQPLWWPARDWPVIVREFPSQISSITPVAAKEWNVNLGPYANGKVELSLLGRTTNGISCDGPPIVTKHPTDQVACEGGVAQLQVRASGTSPLLYQWRRNGIAIPGAIEATLVIRHAATNDLGSYSVVIANAFGTNLSQAANLTFASASVSIAGAWGRGGRRAYQACFG